MSSDHEEDAMLRGFHAAPSDEKLRAMSYTRLCVELTEAERDSVAFHLLEAEKQRRDALDKQQLLRQDVEKNAKPPAEHWYKKPPGVIVIGAIAALFLNAVRVLLQHFGIAF